MEIQNKDDNVPSPFLNFGTRGNSERLTYFAEGFVHKQPFHIVINAYKVFCSRDSGVHLRVQLEIRRQNRR